MSANQAIAQLKGAFDAVSYLLSDSTIASHIGQTSGATAQIIDLMKLTLGKGTAAVALEPVTKEALHEWVKNELEKVRKAIDTEFLADTSALKTQYEALIELEHRHDPQENLRITTELASLERLLNERIRENHNLESRIAQSKSGAQALANELKSYRQEGKTAIEDDRTALNERRSRIGERQAKINLAESLLIDAGIIKRD